MCELVVIDASEFIDSIFVAVDGWLSIGRFLLFNSSVVEDVTFRTPRVWSIDVCPRLAQFVGVDKCTRDYALYIL